MGKIGSLVHERHTGDRKERAFTDAELLILLNGPADDTMESVTLIGCLTGARLEEIFKLKVMDVKDDVLWLIKKLKTKRSSREAPGSYS